MNLKTAASGAGSTDGCSLEQRPPPFNSPFLFGGGSGYETMSTRTQIRTPLGSIVCIVVAILYKYHHRSNPYHEFVVVCIVTSVQDTD